VSAEGPRGRAHRPGACWCPAGRHTLLEAQDINEPDPPMWRDEPAPLSAAEAQRWKGARLKLSPHRAIL
jgi:hypothetical protein